MWERIKMIFRSLFGWMIRSAEDAERILRQYMDDMRAKIPELNRQVVEVVKLEKMLQQQVERLEQKVAQLEQSVIATVKLGEEHKQQAKTMIAASETAKTDLAETQAQLEQAKINSANAKKMREVYKKRINDQIQEAMRQIARAKRAKLEEEVSSLMMSFEMGDATEVLDRTTAQIDEQLARAEARTEVASANIETEMFDVEAATIEQQAEEKYREYQRQLGLIADEEPADRTMEPVSESETQQEPPATATETQEN